MNNPYLSSHLQNPNRDWTFSEILTLYSLHAQGLSTLEIAVALRRSLASVYSKADKLGLSLLPRDNRYPYTSYFYPY